MKLVSLLIRKDCQKGFSEVLLQVFPFTLQAECNLNSAQQHAKTYSERRWKTFHMVGTPSKRGSEPGLRRSQIHRFSRMRIRTDSLLLQFPIKKGEACLSEGERSKTVVLTGTPRSSLRRSVVLIWKRLGRDNLLRQRVHLSWFIAPDRCQILAFEGGVCSALKEISRRFKRQSGD